MRLVYGVFAGLMLCGLLGEMSTNLAEDVEWREKAAMPTPRCILASGVVNGKIYAIGGGANVALSAVEEYDPVTDTWTKKSDMPTPRFTRTCVVNGKIYAIGGSPDLALGLAALEEYNPATDTWAAGEEMLTPDLPVSRDTHAISVVDGKIYVIGGTESRQQASCLARIEECVPVASSVSPQGKLATMWGGIKQSE